MAAVDSCDWWLTNGPPLQGLRGLIIYIESIFIEALLQALGVAELLRKSMGKPRRLSDQSTAARPLQQSLPEATG